MSTLIKGRKEVVDVSDGTAADSSDTPVVALPRRTIDKLLIGMGIVAAVVFAAAGGLLTWGATFSNDYVHDELSSQNIFFPPAEDLRAEGRDDLVKYADEQVTTGPEAEAYASYIDGHLQEVADGKTYSQIDDRGAQAAVDEAVESGASEAEVAELQATADELTAQRNTLFKGVTLRGLLLSSFAWSTIGRIAGISAVVAFVASAVTLVLVVLGVVHYRRMT